MKKIYDCLTDTLEENHHNDTHHSSEDLAVFVVVLSSIYSMVVSELNPTMSRNARTDNSFNDKGFGVALHKEIDRGGI